MLKLFLQLILIQPILTHVATVSLADASSTNTGGTPCAQTVSSTDPYQPILGETTHVPTVSLADVSLTNTGETPCALTVSSADPYSTNTW